MSISEHDLNCICGQPVDLTVTAVHCPRCGRTVEAGDLTPARPSYENRGLQPAA
jgi:hypothetical protein